MNIKERFENFLDERKLKEEIKLFQEKKKEKEAKKNFSKENNQNSQNSEKMLVNTKKFNFEQLKEVGLVAVAVVLIGVRICQFFRKGKWRSRQSYSNCITI